MKNLKELILIFIAAVPYIALSYVIVNDYKINLPMLIVIINALFFHALLTGAYIYKNYGSNN